MSFRTKSEGGFSMVEIMTVVLLVGLLSSIALPNFIKARTSAQMNTCVNNLREIDYAIQQWALDEKRGASSAVEFGDISAYLKRGVICPAGGATFADSYLITIVSAGPSCQRLPALHLLALGASAADPAAGGSGGGAGSAGAGGAGSGSAGAGGAGTGAPGSGSGGSASGGSGGAGSPGSGGGSGGSGHNGNGGGNGNGNGGGHGHGHGP